ncbi:MAG TPA: VIT domain-containing protein [Blastocatellia bacterium]|nr:VIT domain-containing protein [Blastocatellia bacterium]
MSKTRIARTFLLGVFSMLALSSLASAQGVIIPRECPDCIPRPPFPRPVPIPRVLKVKSVKITTKIDSQVATTRVEQVFENESPYRLEGAYFFPIPESASISDFAIYDGEKRMAAEIVEKAKARQIYNDIVRRMIDPGLLEYVGKDLFQANVFPIEPRSTRKIELAYSQVLKSEGGTISYRYPLGSGRRIVQQPIGQVAASVEIVSPVDLKNIFSPSHKISVTRDGERRARLSFEGAGEEAQADFQLYYSLSEKDFGLSLLTHREPGKDGYFLMLLSPKASIKESERLPKDVVFVLDTSGSMSGEKITKARAALKFGVESLSPRDRFNIISFSGEEHLMKSGLVEATETTREAALRFIENLRAEGGTNINDSLVAALRMFQKSDRPAMIVFLTDGLPTVGTTNISEIIKNAAEANRAGVRLFTFGVGHDVNTNLLDKIAADNRGKADYIEPKEDLEIKVSNFFAKVNYPVLSDLKLDLGGVETDLMYPKALPDLFKGSQLAIVGRYKNSVGHAAVRLTGKVGSRSEVFVYDGQSFPEERTDNSLLPRLWATRRIGFLLEQIRMNGLSSELKDEIVALGTRYGIVTPYTSFLVTDDMKDIAGRPMPAETVRRLGAMTERNEAVFVDGGRARQAPEPKGEGAVARSKALRDMSGADSVANTRDEYYLRKVRTVGDKTFHLKDDVWVDADYKETAALPKIELKFGSEEFFAAIAKEPRLGELFSIGQKVIVVFKNKVYQVQ